MRERFTGLWRDPEFLKYWLASAISDVGSQVTALVFPLIGALTLAASPWQMGILNAASSAPILLIGLVAGVWVDRLPRRPVLIASDVARAALLATIPLASKLGVLTIELLCTVAFLVGALTVFFDIAHLAFLPALVARGRLVEGNAKLEVTAAGAQVVGPGFGGTLVGALGAPFAVLIDAVSFLVSGWLIGRTAATEPSRAAARVRSGVWLEIRPLGVGLFLATGGIGSLAGALVAGPATRRFGPGPMLIMSQLAFGVTGLLVPLAVLLPRAALILVVAAEFGQWMAVIVYYVNAVSVRQAITPDRLQGRVNATMRFFAGGAMPP